MNTPPDPNSPAGDLPPAVAAEAVPADLELDALQSQMLSLQAQGRNGASWFYWAAALSLVNSVLAAADAARRFLFGLGITQLTDGIGSAVAQKNPEIAVVAKAVAFGFALIVAAVMVFFGWMANKRSTPIFTLGMVLYLLDGLLLLLLSDFISLAFHAFVLYQMWQGLSAYRQLSTILSSAPAAA